MTSSSVERKVRAGLPAIRLMQAYLPFPVACWLIRQGMARVRPAAGITREVVSAGGVQCEWLRPLGGANDRVLLYLHGGGFVFGLTPLHLQMVTYLAQQMGMSALLVDYRLAPGHPFPAALDDCVTVYRWLGRQAIAAQDTVIAGDSAGGNLTIASLMTLRDRGEPLPAAAACLSPVADLSAKGAPPPDFRDPLLHPRAMRRYNESYVAHHNARDPLISPVFGDWHGLPPLLVHAGEDEVLRDDAVRIEELARAAGVDVRLAIYPRMWHVWQLNLALPQAIHSLDDIAQFLGSRLAPVTSQPLSG
jgi:epsilon-lactone hydrolase